MVVLSTLVLSLAVSACGDDQDGGPPTDSAGTDMLDVDVVEDTAPDTAEPAEPIRPAHCSDKLSPGPAPSRRLTRTEYNHTVADLLGITTDPGNRFPPEEETLGFDNNASSRNVTQIHVERYQEAAENMVSEMLATNRAQVLKCDADSVGALLCAEWTIRDFGKLCFRRPLTAVEQARYWDFFGALYAEDNDFDRAIGMVLEVMLQSPQFLYRLEVGHEDADGDGVAALTSFEIASRLSYLLWNSMPDDYLLAAAEVGSLDTPEGIAVEARRLLENPRARRASLHFHRQWLQVDDLALVHKDADVFPEYDAALRDRMTAETERFVTHAIFEGTGDLPTLLAADYTIADATLAAHYGVSPPTGELDEDGFGRVSLEGGQRAGLFTHGSTMTVQSKPNQSSPVLRGKWVREQLLCDHLDPPPADVDITPPAVEPGLSTRERFRQHSDDPACSGCHNKMDPLGFTFENYDALGRWRTIDEGGSPVDPTGEVLFTWDADGPVDNAVDMAQTLAQSEQVHDCYIKQWFRYTHARDVTFADECNMFDLRKAFYDAELDIQSLLVALTQTEAFRYRPVADPDTTPVPEEVQDGE